MIEREGPLAGQLVHHPVGAFDDPVGVPVEIGFVSLEPESLGEHPFGGDSSRAVTQGGIEGCADFLGFDVSALIHPEQGGAERMARQVAGDDGAGRAIQADRQHALLGDPRLRQNLQDRVARRLEPVAWRLLRPSGTRIEGVDRDGGVVVRPPLKIH